MLNLVLSRSSRNLVRPSILLHRYYHIGKAGSVHTAIQRGLRKSKGTGFRGKEGRAVSPNDPREKYRKQHDIPGYQRPVKDNFGPIESDRFEKGSHWGEDGRAAKSDERGSTLDRGAGKRRQNTWETRGKTAGKKRPTSREIRGERAALKLRIRLGERLIAGEEERGRDSSQRTTRFERAERSPGYSERRERDSDDSPRSFKDLNGEDFGRQREIGGRTLDRLGRDSGLSLTRSFGHSTDGDSYGKRSNPSESNNGGRYPSLSFRKRASDSKFGNSSSFERNPSNGHMSNQEPTSSNRSIKYDDRFSFHNATGPARKRKEATSSSRPKFIQIADNRMPLSIPYTTPASEFLYGTSVVEAALNSRSEPRRKLYKFYIYTGKNREDADQDARLERLASRSGIEVVRVGDEGLRVMDKMSAGRPHNGYILEASPLPRLPVTSLGQLTIRDGEDGFEVSTDYQSREEAVVNGTSNFIKISRNSHGMKPLVLLLDSISDPGNLGGIIRTASFLGVTAIAISTRNSASFTPVVLKASAGASEEVTLFTVNKPAGFVVDSKTAGWKVFAAVTPRKKHDPAMPASLSTDDLKDPLSEDPCILMLGSEGEGLRSNLRSKADVDLYIKGSKESHMVDSLNVSVAAGILCNSFLRRSRTTEGPSIRQEHKKAPEDTARLF